MVKKTVLWLFVIVLGITFGAGIYEARIVVPDWIQSSEMYWNADAANHSNTGIRFWVFVTSIPLTILTVASIIYAFKSQEDLRKWWGLAAGTALVDRLMTFGYFVPTMIFLMENGNSHEKEIVESAIFWSKFNYIRIAVVLLAWLAAMKAFSVYYQKSMIEITDE